jgi:hypothetical protein
VLHWVDSLFHLAREKPNMTKKIQSKDMVEDIRSGLSDSELMQKYGLSEVGLQKVFRRLLDTKSLTPEEFEAWSIFSNETVPLNIRLHERFRPNFLLPIFEAHRPENSGSVVSISRHGIGAEGLRAETGEVMNLVIPLDRILGGTPLLLQARCRWVRDAGDGGVNFAGFFLIAVAQGSWEKLLEYAIARSSPEPFQG